MILTPANVKDKETNDNDDVDVVTNVCQFRVRSIFGETRNLSFFYNTGSLSGDELMHQLIHVLVMMASIGYIILGISSDAGGNNSRLFKLLRGRNKVHSI